MKSYHGFYFGKDRFASDKSRALHKRLASHKINVYTFVDLSWSKRGKLWTPSGILTPLFEEDLGEKIMAICGEGELHEYIEDVRLQMPDGTLVIGKRYRVSPYEGRPDERMLSNEFLNISFDQSRFKSDGYFGYYFSVKKETMEMKSPKEFHILKYVDIDGQRVQEERVVLRSRYEGDLPNRLKFKSFVATEK